MNEYFFGLNPAHQCSIFRGKIPPRQSILGRVLIEFTNLHIEFVKGTHAGSWRKMTPESFCVKGPPQQPCLHHCNYSLTLESHRTITRPTSKILRDFY